MKPYKIRPPKSLVRGYVCVGDRIIPCPVLRVEGCPTVSEEEENPKVFIGACKYDFTRRTMMLNAQS